MPRVPKRRKQEDQDSRAERDVEIEQELDAMELEEQDGAFDDETLVPEEAPDGAEEQAILAALQGQEPAPQGLAPAQQRPDPVAQVGQAAEEINGRALQAMQQIEQARMAELEAASQVISEAARAGSQTASGPEGLI